MTTTRQCVADCMTEELFTIDRDADLIDAIRQMDINWLAVLPVIDESGRVCGVICNSDLIGLTYDLHCDVAVLPRVSDAVRKTLTDALAQMNESLKVADAMTSEVVTVSPQVSIPEAAKMMIDNAVHHLLVVDEAKFPLGIISTYDIVRTVSENG